jgi:hypothetical protein
MRSAQRVRSLSALLTTMSKRHKFANRKFVGAVAEHLRMRLRRTHGGLPYRMHCSLVGTLQYALRSPFTTPNERQDSLQSYEAE